MKSSQSPLRGLPFEVRHAVRTLASDKLQPHGAALCMEAHWTKLMSSAIVVSCPDGRLLRHQAFCSALAEDPSLSWERMCRARSVLKHSQYDMSYVSYLRWNMDKVSFGHFVQLLDGPAHVWQKMSDHHKPGFDRCTWLPPWSSYCAPCQLSRSPGPRRMGDFRE